MEERPVPALTPQRAALYSLFIPGSSQFLSGRRIRAVALLVGIVLLLALVAWWQTPVLYLPVAALWLWNVWDGYRLAQGRESRLTLPLLLGALVVYTIALGVVDVRFGRLFSDWRRVQPYVTALANPELFTYPTEDRIGVGPIQVPCIDPLPPPDREATSDPQVIFSAPCADVGDTITIVGRGFFPDVQGELRWLNPIGDIQRVTREGQQVVFTPDASGTFTETIRVPQAVPVPQRPGPGETQTHAVRAIQQRPFGSPVMTETLALVLEKMGETIALAFLSTVLGVIFAVPLSFFAARNLMDANVVTRAVYYVVRTALNIIRSIETLMWAIIFAVWVGLGPFAGTLALWLHTVAALGKLYSEAIESIDPGPIEAIRATGARWPQVVIYAVLPQIMPTFTSFTVYRWDINVRLSTVIGLVSDAGIGFLVVQWIRLNRFSSMATALIAIILVVASLDYFSGWVRQRIIEGGPTVQRRSGLRTIARAVMVIVFIAAFIWSWRIARIDLIELVRGAPDGLRIAQSFTVPDMFDRPQQRTTLSRPLPVPCESGETGGGDANLTLTPPCGPPGTPLLIEATGLPPNQLVSVRWQFEDEAFLRIRSNCCTTDADGNLQLETTISPLMEVGREGGLEEAGAVVITWEEVAGSLRFSDSFHTVVDLSIETLLMALLATTFGSLFAIPLSFFAARNIMGNSPLGRGVYYAFRTLFNITRSIEPLILVLIAGVWVGLGPFAGMLALALNNIPNLGKLFSESIEEIDTGPVDAVRATGANSMQTLVYAIAPQLVPRFLAFILYQWDINIRMSTVIGFVGGGGIGRQFQLWVSTNQYSAAGMATWAIVAMVWSMDYLSARAREEMV
ncbi:MAG: phosphonate ABC transporter, permease protein PhnE [Chloroflexi bacterium]|jgi:phosphonate transport system permease protein|nr:phosphonate ABC transporter, permease protein PhnE [Chloroflexota bacterium]